jgi:hypothetical protein
MCQVTPSPPLMATVLTPATTTTATPTLPTLRPPRARRTVSRHPIRAATTPQRIPDKPPEKTRQRNSIARRWAEWLKRAFVLNIEQARSFLRLLETIAWLNANLPGILSYQDPPKTLEELHDAVARPRLGYERHHIVERHHGSKDESANWNRFRDRLETRENLVLVPYWKHVEISSWYSTPNTNPRYGGLSPRDYLRGKSWDEQYQLGLEMLLDFGVLK